MRIRIKMAYPKYIVQQIFPIKEEKYIYFHSKEQVIQYIRKGKEDSLTLRMLNELDSGERNYFLRYGKDNTNRYKVNKCTGYDKV